MVRGVVHILICAPPALLVIVLLMVAAVVAFVVSSAPFAAGAPGVPAAASVAASAVPIVMSAVCLADSKAAVATKGIPRHAGNPPINTLTLPGPPVKTGGKGCAPESVILGACLLIKNSCFLLS